MEPDLIFGFQILAPPAFQSYKVVCSSTQASCFPCVLEENMTEAIVSFVIERLGEFIIQDAKFLFGVSDKVEFAQTELQLMQGFLKDADLRQRDDETVRVWVAQIRKAAYDLEDVIEIFILRVATKKRGMKNVLKRFGCVLKKGVDLHKIGSQIENVTTQLSNLRSSLQTYNIKEIRNSRGATSLYERQQQVRRTYSHIIERDVVGLENSAEELVKHLVKKEFSHRIVSIWGMGGLGKTTLAKQIYRHNEVRRHFGCFVWICISQQFQVRSVWEEILIKLISATTAQREEFAKLRDDEIAKKIYLLQQKSRCLVVLDDIWSIEAWESLKAAFPLYDEETESRILLTTRNKEVALHSNGFIYQPRPLNDDESWELFEKIAIFGRERITFEVSTKMKELGKKMLQHCVGLPLAVIVLAGLLARKDTINEWETVLKNVYAYIRRGKDHEHEVTGTSWVLSLSYDNLPYYLKPCFLYLGHFPEDFEISVKRLTQLWMAEGLISLVQQRQGSMETMEEIAFSYLNELVERCMVQIGERGSIRKIKSCQLHDLMRDLCLLKAEEENFLQTIDLSHRETMCALPSPTVTEATLKGKVRRLAIYVDDNVDKLFPSRYERDNRLRSLLYFGPRYWMPSNNKLVSPLFKDFKLLRVLKVEGIEPLLKLPSEIGNMVHLRFLSLRHSFIKWLPSSLGNLICMQTLDLRINGTDVVPDVFWMMEQLRHLYLPFYYTARGKKLRLSTLHDLQTLHHVSSLCCDLNDLTQLTSLRKLAIRVTSPLKNLEETLKSISSTLDRIRSLYVLNLLGIHSGTEVAQIVLSCRHIYKLDLNGRTVELPDLQHFPNLTKLTLCRCDLKANQMAVLEKQPNLKTLRLMEQTFEDGLDTLVFSKGSFLQLESLFLICIYELRDFTVEEGAMPSLRRLCMKRCSGLTTLPDGLRHITTLWELSFTEMSRTLHSRLQVGGDDFYKIQHVPSIVFANMQED